MLMRQKVVALCVGVGLVLFIFELIRRRRLREEYSWLWMLCGGSVAVLALWYDLLRWVSDLVGAVVVTSGLFFCGILFLVLICLQYAVRISQLSLQVKNLAQKVALLEEERQRKEGKGTV